MENWGKSFRFSTTSFTTGDLAVDVAPSQTLHPYNHQIISRLAGGIIWHFHPNIRKPLAFQNTNRKHLQNAQPQKELLRRAGDWGLPQQATSDRLDSQMHCLRRMANQKCKFIFQEDAITLFLNTNLDASSAFVYTNAKMLVGVVPQSSWTVMEHHRLCTTERKHFLVQKIVFMDFYKSHQ